MGAVSTGILTIDRMRAVDVIVSGGDDTAAALAAGVTPRTVRRWKTEPAFADAIIRGQDELLEKTSIELTRTAQYAVALLRKFLADGEMKPQIRLRAAEILLSSTLEWRRLKDWERRLAALEDAVNARS